MYLLEVLSYLIIALITCVYFYMRSRYSYWAERGVVHEAPNYLYGNMKEFGRTKSLSELFREFYKKYKHQGPFAGFYLFVRPSVVLFDLELVKNVMVKDFAYFAHRGQYYNERDDPLSAHLFNLDGPRWRTMRAKLTPTFTSGKMKFMFPVLVEVAEKFMKVLEEIIEDAKTTAIKEPENDFEIAFEVKDLLARFTTDVIGTCAFGLDVNSLKDPKTQFREMGKKIFTSRRHGRIVNSFSTAFPNLARRLGIKIVHDDVAKFFMNVVRETVEQREKLNIKRNDFLNLLIDLKNQNNVDSLTLEEIAAQAFVFFLAGFETSSSTMSFSLYELAVNQDVQDKARAEINEMLEQHDGKFTYEGIKELKYLQKVLYETLRMYSIVIILLRKTVKDYQLPNSQHIFEKGTSILIPVDAIHHDPEIYPNPEVFDPERFSPAEMKKRDSIAWLPFGEGPRNCIGLRFGEMQSLVGLAMLLKNFRFSPSKETKIPIEIEKSNFLCSSKGGIVLKVERL